MSHLSVFLNTQVENRGTLAWIGDIGLTPFRYLCNGKTVRIESSQSNQEITVHHVASFHCYGEFHSSKTNNSLNSSSPGLIKTAFSIAFLIPGLLLGTLFKGISYVFSDVRESHRLVKNHFTPIDIKKIGSESKPIRTRDELRKAVREPNPENRPIRNLIIHGDGNLTIAEDPGIIRLHPEKLILKGVKLVHEPSDIGCFDVLINPDKWQDEHVQVNTIDQALKVRAPRRGWFSFKRYNMIFYVAKPQST